jgi:regulator of protease activity HflC (stomatin/prohibitin superfamily)
VNEGEVAVVIEGGRSGGSLPPGRYVFEKARVVGALDIVWIRTGQQTLKWGLGNVTSKDRINVSARGMLYVRVVDAEVFNREVVAGKIVLSERDMQRHFMPRVQGVLRTAIAHSESLDLELKRQEFVELVQRSLGEEFGRLGMVIAGFEVVEITLPPEFQAVIAMATMETHAGQAKLIAAGARAQMTQLEAVAAAQAKLADGMVDLQLLTAMQQQGIDPMKLKMLEALNTMAANPSQGLLGDGGRAGFMGQIAAATLAAPSPPAAAPKQLSESPMPPSATPSGVGDGGVGDPIEKLEAQMVQLDEKLLSGDVSEATHGRMMARLEARLDKLLGG